MNPQILKNRISIKRLEIKIQEAIEENFGYCPNYNWFNELLDERFNLLINLERNDKDWLCKFEEICNTDNLKKLKKANVY